MLADGGVFYATFFENTHGSKWLEPIVQQPGNEAPISRKRLGSSPSLRASKPAHTLAPTLPDFDWEALTIEFTAHNVRLPDGTETLPGVPPLEDGPAYRAVFRSLLELCPPVAADGTRARAVDLGALEGGWSVLLARAGYDTLGIEGRANNLELCEYVRATCGLPNLSFVQDDVRNLARHGTFDVCFCSGLLYHLDTPSSFLQLAAAQTSRVLVLHTHYAPEALDGSEWARHLTDWDEHEGRRGRWFREWPKDSSSDEVENYRWASLENPRSFWLRKGDLLQTVADAGFPMVYEQHDFVGDMAGSTYQSDQSRSLFVCVKPRPATGLVVVTPDPMRRSAPSASRTLEETTASRSRRSPPVVPRGRVFRGARIVWRRVPDGVRDRLRPLIFRKP